MEIMKNILITGANGQLGNEMRLLSNEFGSYHYFFTDVQELDITDRMALIDFVKQKDIHCIVNCAAYTAVDKAEENAELCDRLNHLAPGYLAEAAERNHAMLVQISTDYVFDGTHYIPYKEEDPTCPNSIYGKTKLAGEKAVLENCSRTVIIRTAWLYSTFGNNFVKTMMRLGKEKSQLGVIFDQIGTPTYARDLARAVFAAIGKEARGIYHFSNEGVISWYDFTKAIHRLADINTCKVVPLHTDEYPTLAARPHYSVLDKTKIKKDLNIEIPYWEDSLKDCITELQKNQ